MKVNLIAAGFVMKAALSLLKRFTQADNTPVTISFQRCAKVSTNEWQDDGVDPVIFMLEQ